MTAGYSFVKQQQTVPFKSTFSSTASSAPIASNSRQENTWISLLKAISHISSDNDVFITKEGEVAKTMVMTASFYIIIVSKICYVDYRIGPLESLSLR